MSYYIGKENRLYKKARIPHSLGCGMNCRIRNVSGDGQIISPTDMKENTTRRSIGIQLPHKNTGCGLKSTSPKTVEIQDVRQGEKEKS